MSLRITISDAARHAGETVEIAGWLYNLRKSGKIVFPILRDGSCEPEAIMLMCIFCKMSLQQ